MINISPEIATLNYSATELKNSKYFQIDSSSMTDTMPLRLVGHFTSMELLKLSSLQLKYLRAQSFKVIAVTLLSLLLINIFSNFNFQYFILTQTRD
jgi:hypothetical protein